MLFHLLFAVCFAIGTPGGHAVHPVRISASVDGVEVVVGNLRVTGGEADVDQADPKVTIRCVTGRKVRGTRSRNGKTEEFEADALVIDLQTGSVILVSPVGR